MESASSKTTTSKGGSQIVSMDQEPTGDLSSNEREIIERQLSLPPAKASYLVLYRYATKIDVFVLAVSAICAISSGAIMLLTTVKATLPERT